MVTLTIDGVQVSVPAGTTILEAARKAGIRIPALCHNPRLQPYGACRMCVVQQKGRRNLLPACFNPVRKGMEILTDTPEVIRARKVQLQLILMTHPLDCPVCDAGGQCQLQDLVYEYGVIDNPFPGEKADQPVDHVSPFIERNVNRCVLCGMCVRVCDEVVGANELSFVGRGFHTKIGTDFDRPLNCEFCGQCVSVCPVGALNDRHFLHRARVWDLKETETTCAYCGVGCTLLLGARNGRLLRARAAEGRGVNQGNLCVKGRFGWEYVGSGERLTTPLMRKNGALEPASWEEALERVGENFRKIKEEKGGEALAGLCSSRLTNEELYLFQKLLRGVLLTDHLDHAAGQGYQAHLALKEALGYAASTNSINEIREAEVILALRSDLSETHPVIKSEVVLAVKRRRAKLIVVNSRSIGLNKFSALSLQVRPGTEALLVNGFLRAILKENLAPPDFLAGRTAGREDLERSLEPFTLEAVSAGTGIPAEEIRRAAGLFAQAARSVILISTGSFSGPEDEKLARSAANLALLTGQIGREGTGIFLLGEKSNSQGALDMGLVPGLLPGYAGLADPEERRRFAAAWGLPLPERPGLGAPGILQKAREGRIKGLYLVGENPLVTYPDSAGTKAALEALEFLVVQDLFLTETAALAHVVLPAASFAEKEGTFTNAERRVQLVRPALHPPGQARPDLWIFQELAKVLGARLGGETAGSAMEEIRRLVPPYGGMEYGLLEAGGRQWPCPTADHPGSPALYTDGFPAGKARLAAAEAAEAFEDREFPFVLITGSTKFHSGSLSRKSPGLLRLEGESCVEIHPADARRLGVAGGQKVTLESSQGKVTLQAVVSERSAPGLLFARGSFDPAGAGGLAGWGRGMTRVRVEKG